VLVLDTIFYIIYIISSYGQVIDVCEYVNDTSNDTTMLS